MEVILNEDEEVRFIFVFFLDFFILTVLFFSFGFLNIGFEYWVVVLE